MWIHIVASFAAIATLLATAVSIQAPAWPVAFTAAAPAPACIGKSVFELLPFHNARPQFAHAASAVTLRDGRQRAVWYQGSEELRPDVRIWTATFDGARWSPPRPIIDTAETTAGTGRYINRLANTVIFRDSHGDLVLVFAALGPVGGWDGVSLKVARSRDEGETWLPPRNLTTTPIFNFGTNIRGPAVSVEGGLFVLPASHEFAKSFPESILLDEDSRVVGKRRIGISYKGSQPFVSVRDARNASAFMRVHQAFALLSRTGDAGASWTEPVQTQAVNDDAPVVIARIKDELLMVTSRLNRATARWSLVFAVSGDDGMTWRDIHRQPFGSGPLQIPRYPWLMMGADGLYHILFSFMDGDTGSELMHVRFSRDWVAEKEGVPCR